MIFCSSLFGPFFIIFYFIFKYIFCQKFDVPIGLNISFSNFNFNTSERSTLISRNNRINIPQEKREKSVIIQKYSDCCEIEEIDSESYLVNREEIKISYLLYQSLKLISQDIIIYWFNIAQVNLLKERFKYESYIKIILFNKNCSNLEEADYIIINYIDSPISEELKREYPSFNSTLNSREYYNKNFLKIFWRIMQNQCYILLAMMSI